MMIQLFLSLSDSASTHSGNHVEIPSRHFCYALRIFLLLFSSVLYLKWRAMLVTSEGSLEGSNQRGFSCRYLLQFEHANYLLLTKIVKHVLMFFDKSTDREFNWKANKAAPSRQRLVKKTFCLICKSRFPRNVARHAMTGAMFYFYRDW